MASTRTAATSRTLRRICLAAAGASGVIFAWQATILYWRIPGYLMPSPASVLHAVFTNWQVLASQSSYTLGAAAIGLTISTAFAVVLALLFSMSRTLEQASMPAVIAFRSAPVAAVAPIIMLFFGRGIATSIAVVTIVSFFPMLVKAIPANRIAWGSNYPASKGQLKEMVDEAKSALSCLSQNDQDWIFAKTAQSLYPALAD